MRYGLRLVFYTVGSLDSIKNFTVIPCAPISKRISYAETSQMCLKPQPAQGERESARSEGRHAGAYERLFESLPGLAGAYQRYLTIQIIHILAINKEGK